MTVVIKLRIHGRTKVVRESSQTIHQRRLITIARATELHDSIDSRQTLNTARINITLLSALPGSRSSLWFRLSANLSCIIKSKAILSYLCKLLLATTGRQATANIRWQIHKLNMETSVRGKSIQLVNLGGN